MLKAEDNEILTRVGPGTLMGELLRRYWTPACLTAEIPEPGGAPARVRLLGENLVAFRDTTGRIGLVQENCPHRGASLYYGRNEDAVLRCVYHGWAYDTEGRCVDMPSEPAPFCEKVRMRAYPVHESGGIVWAYLGPRETMTPFRDFGTDGLGGAEVMATKQHSAPATGCRRWKATSTPRTSPTCTNGTASTTSPTTAPTSPATPPTPCPGNSGGTTAPPASNSTTPGTATATPASAPPPTATPTSASPPTRCRYHTMVASIPFSLGQGMFIPIDDDNCWRYFTAPRTWRNPRNLGGANLFSIAPFSTPVSTATDGIVPRRYTAENDYLIDRDVQRTSTFSGVADFVSQDLMVTELMGPIYDRTQEQLGSTDKAISRMRHLLISAAKGLAEGKEPPAVGAGMDFASIRGAEKILEPGEDWRDLGTDDDPVVREALGATTGEQLTDMVD